MIHSGGMVQVDLARRQSHLPGHHLPVPRDRRVAHSRRDGGTSTLAAGHYVLHRSAKGWSEPDQTPIVDVAEKVVDLSPGNIWTGGKGIFTLYERVNKTRGIKFDTLDKRFHFKMQVHGLGELRDIYANSNPWK